VGGEKDVGGEGEWVCWAWGRRGTVLVMVMSNVDREAVVGQPQKTFAGKVASLVLAVTSSTYAGGEFAICEDAPKVC
jgi:hypothetical protein